MTGITLDRIELDDAGGNPRRIADAIHEQLGPSVGPVPVREIAYALDIYEIRIEPLTTIEGALVTTLERGYGSILVNAVASHARRRFTIAHELGHFLNPWHQPNVSTGFECTREDTNVKVGDMRNRHLRQEAEANEFAIELLVPRQRLRSYLTGAVDLEQVQGIAVEFDVSKAAAVRHYVALRDERLAVVFSEAGHVNYVDLGPRFPSLRLRARDAMPVLPKSSGNSSLTSVEEADPEDWLSCPNETTLGVQTLYQQNGYAITLLRVETADADEDSEENDDAFERFSRLSDRQQN